jgi:predicted S18 family serine protease
MQARLFLVLVLVLMLAFASQALAKTSMFVPAIDAQGRGILTTIEASAVQGEGDIYVDIYPRMSIETQQSAEVAAKIAAELAAVNRSRYNIFYKIIAQAEVVDGPSGGSAMALLAYAELSGKRIRQDLSTTGTIELGGGIGKIGGVLEKAEAVARAGKKIFLIPAGQSVQDDVDVPAYAAQKWGLQVIEVSNIREAAKIATTPEGSSVEAPKRITQPLVLPRITPSEKLEPFLQLVAVEVEELNSTIEDSKGKISDVLMASALDALNKSKKLLGEGYYYSAANLAFVAKINLEAAASNFSIPELQKALVELEKESESWLPAQKTLENFEWVAGGELRYWWARQRLEETKEKLDSEDAFTAAKDYFSIKNWLQAAKRISALAENISSAEAVDESSVRNLARNALLEANFSLESGADGEAATHYNAALKAYDAGNYVAALYDAQFATAFSEAAQEASDKTALEIEGTLESASSLPQYGSSVWAELYFANSIYNLAEYNRSSEIDLLLNALKLQYLAKRLDESASDARAKLSGAPSGIIIVTPSPTAVATPGGAESSPEFDVTIAGGGSDSERLLLIMLAFGIILIVAAALMLVRPKAPGKPKQPASKEALDRLDNLLLDGRISERTWKILRRKYLARAGEERKASAQKK